MNSFSFTHYTINERALAWMLFLTRLMSSVVLLYISIGGLLYYREFLYNTAFAGLPLFVGIGLLLLQLFVAVFVLLGYFARIAAGISIIGLAGVCFIFFGADFNKIYVALILLLSTSLLPTLLVGAGKYSVDFNRERARLERQMRG